MATSSNTLIPSASAKVSIRLAPDEDPMEAYAAVQRHVEKHTPWGARVEVHLDDQGAGFAAEATGPVYDQARAAFADAWGVEPVDIGVGGSIPFVAAFAQRFPEAGIPRHRGGGPRRPRARRQRVPAPRRVPEGLRGRGAAAGPSGRPAALTLFRLVEATRPGGRRAGPGLSG